jgi:hypothetical protein
MTSHDPAADLARSRERWIAWLAGETGGGTPASTLHVLWDLLEEWFASDDFPGSAVVAARRPRPGRFILLACSAYKCIQFPPWLSSRFGTSPKPP